MKSLAGFILWFALLLPHQAIPWNTILPAPATHLQATTLSKAQHRAVRRLLHAEVTKSANWCNDTTWVDTLQASTIPLGRPNTMLLEASGCMSGDGNGSIWIVEWMGNRPVLLGKTAGWLYQVLPQTSHGLNDFTVGWHMGAREYLLGLFRFDGHQYHAIENADVRCENEESKCTATPRKGPFQ